MGTISGVLHAQGKKRDGSPPASGAKRARTESPMIISSDDEDSAGGVAIPMLDLTPLTPAVVPKRQVKPAVRFKVDEAAEVCIC